MCAICRGELIEPCEMCVGNSNNNGECTITTSVCYHSFHTHCVFAFLATSHNNARAAARGGGGGGGGGTNDNDDGGGERCPICGMEWTQDGPVRTVSMYLDWWKEVSSSRSNTLSATLTTLPSSTSTALSQQSGMSTQLAVATSQGAA